MLSPFNPKRYSLRTVPWRSRRVVLTALVLVLALVGAAAWDQLERRTSDAAPQQQQQPAMLGVPSNLLAVPTPEAGNSYSLDLSWTPAPNASGHIVHAARASDPDTAVRYAYSTGDVGAATMSLPDGETYAFRVGAFTGDIANPFNWSWSEWSTAHLCAGEVREIATVFTDLLRDDLEVVYVVDTSGSMAGEKIVALRGALEALRDAPVRNTQVALMRFSSSSQTLFNFTVPGTAPWTTAWNQALSAISAYGGTQMYSALQAANNLLPDADICPTPTTCRERRIVLMSDGQAGDSSLANSTINALVTKGVVVDTVAFGADADETGLQDIATRTGGLFVKAR